jgi:dolichyl-phosphate-mannose--protein O-mannosyl transferase
MDVGNLPYNRKRPEMQETLRWLASLWVTGSGLVIAARVRPLLMGWAFVGLTVGSLLWIVVGYLSTDYALLAQNVVISLINGLGIYRWLIWKGKA